MIFHQLEIERLGGFSSCLTPETIAYNYKGTIVSKCDGAAYSSYRSYSQDRIRADSNSKTIVGDAIEFSAYSTSAYGSGEK